MTLIRKYLFAAAGLTTLFFISSCNGDWNTIFSDKFSRVDKQVLLMARDGDPGAQTSLGLIFERGLGVNINPKEAMKWYYLAASQGDSLATFHLGSMYERGLGTNISYERAAYWYSLSAKQGSEPAMVALAYFYENGMGVSRDYNKAAELYLSAERLRFRKSELINIDGSDPYRQRVVNEYLRNTLVPDPGLDPEPNLLIGGENKFAIEVDINAIVNTNENN
tara:strand:+ start:418 stop:1083 length:666 start_codon:yes stop_codon:yes gene_type:complete